MGREFQVNKLCRFPIFKEFECADRLCEFLECNFSGSFDGLIGNNILSPFDAIIDYRNRQMTVGDAAIPFYLNDEEEDYRVGCRRENVVEILNNETQSGSICSILDLELPHLNVTDRNKLILILKKHHKTFYQGKESLSFTNRIKHRVNTQNDIPVYAKLYRYPEIHRKEIDRQIKEMLEQGVIRESSSSYNSPIWIVPKKLDVVVGSCLCKQIHLFV